MAQAFILFAETFPGIPATLGLSGAFALAIYAQVRRGRSRGSFRK